VMTLLAFLHFKKKNVTTVVLEVGLGGRYDATNVINSDVAVISQLGLEHQAVLGDTIEEIAHEKCGVLKPNQAVVIFPQEKPVMEIVCSEANQHQDSTIVKSLDWEAKSIELHASYQTVEVTNLSKERTQIDFPLLGDHQVQNLRVALQAAETYLKSKRHKSPSFNNIKNGIEKLKLSGRVERVLNEPIVILDGAHDEISGSKLGETIRKVYRPEKVYLILGMFQDKKPKEFVKSLKQLPINKIFTVPVQSHRTFTAEDLKEYIKLYHTDIAVGSSLSSAYEECLSLVSSKDMILITGSNYLVGEYKNTFSENLINV